MDVFTRNKGFIFAVNNLYSRSLSVTMQPKRIKLIWDFKGPASLPTAKHHQIHLDEFVLIEKLEHCVSGYMQLSEMHAIAYLTVDAQDMLKVRDALKPHRGEVGE